MTDKEKRELKDGVISIFKRFNILDHTATIGELRDNILRYIDSLQEEPALKIFENMLNAKTPAESLDISEEEYAKIEDEFFKEQEEPLSEDLEKELPKIWDRETLDEYAYQVAYDLSNDWMRETPTWDDVETACKLGAEWKEKQMIELGMSVSNKVQKGESV